jgi:ATP synthase, subunit E
MTGLEKITSEIKADADKSIAAIIDKANAEAKSILAGAEKEAAEAIEKVNHDVSVRLSASKSTAESAAALKKRRLILEEKQKLIGEVIEEAKSLIYALPDNVYFEKILKLAEKNVSPAEGTIIFNAKDLSRLPADFETKLNVVAVAKGGKLTVSKETRPIDGGFVLLYEGIDQNCSITSLFETNIEAVQDKIQKLLF